MFEKSDSAALSALPMAERLQVLRERMAAVPGRVGAHLPTAEAVLTSADVLAVPGALGDLLPGGGLPRGAVVACPSGSVLCAILAAASSSGSTAAVIGGQWLGLLAAHEMGAALNKIMVVDAADRAAEVAAVLCDGLPLIVLDVPKLRIAPRAAEGLRARVRNKGAVLLATSGDWMRQPQLRIDAFPVAAEGMAEGYGRIKRLVFEVRVSVQERAFRRGRLVLDGISTGHTGWSAATPIDPPALHPVRSRAG